MWSKSHPRCRGCQKTDAKHMAAGLCVRCYLKRYRESAENRARIVVQKRVWYLFHRPAELAKRKTWREQHHFSGLREAVLRRDGRQCVNCGARKRLVVHHRDGQGRGSKRVNNRLGNLVTMCRACHINEYRAELLRARRAKRTALQLNKHGRWSQRFDACLVCGETFSKHASNGLCTRCYQRTVQRRAVKPKRFDGIPAATTRSRNRRTKQASGSWPWPCSPSRFSASWP